MAVRFLRHQRRVAILGPARAGKTVLLTSLINHLKHHHPDHQFVLGRNGRTPELSFDRELDPTHAFARFPYEDYRHQLQAGRWWPVKTRAVTRFRFQYYRSDWPFSYGELDLLDFPGDRVVDLMMSDRSFGDWSQRMLETFQQGSYSELTKPYTVLFEGQARPSAEAILSTYRQTLVQLLVNYQPLVSPSAFVVAPDGSYLGDAPERWAEHGIAGLDTQRQFAPLPGRLEHEAPQLWRQFDAHYEAYRDAIAHPLAHWMRQCDTLVVLVDVLNLLMAGPAAYLASRDLFDRLMAHLDPGRDWLAKSTDALGSLISLGHLRWRAITRLGLVAPKADLVRPEDHNNLAKLVADYAHQPVKRHRHRGGLKTEYFTYAAINSTRPAEDGQLQGYRRGETRPVAFEPSPLPEHWPKDWSGQDYAFPRMAPYMPPREDAPPEHLRLDALARFMLE